MEEDNRRDEQAVEKPEIDVNALIEEYNKLRDAYNNLVARVNELSNTWMLTRANYLLEVIKTKEFSKEIKEKAMNEFSEFLYPAPKEEVVEEKKEN